MLFLRRSHAGFFRQSHPAASTTRPVSSALSTRKHERTNGHNHPLQRPADSQRAVGRSRSGGHGGGPRAQVLALQQSLSEAAPALAFRQAALCPRHLHRRHLHTPTPAPTPAPPATPPPKEDAPAQPTEAVVVVVEAANATATAADGGGADGAGSSSTADVVSPEFQFLLGFDRSGPSATVCPLCGRLFSDPRVLPCLHSYCAPCLVSLVSLDAHAPRPQTEGTPEKSPLRTAPHSRSNSTAGSDAGVVGGGVAEGQQGVSTGAGRLLQCPACGHVSRLPAGGVSSLTPDYVAQHRMVLASLNRESTRLLCDACPGEQTAAWRCSECMVNLCDACRSAHDASPSSASSGSDGGGEGSAAGGGGAKHEVLSVAEARRRGIRRVRRQLMCPVHAQQELKFFCAACARLVCADCTQGSGAPHRGHSVQPVARAAAARGRAVKEALERARPTAERGAAALAQLQELAQQIQSRCSQVQSDVDRFVAAYVAALEEHRRALRRQAREAADAKLAAVRARARRLERVAVDACGAVAFTDDLLKEGSEAEVLSLSSTVLRRLQSVAAGAAASASADGGGSGGGGSGGGGSGGLKQLMDAPPRCVTRELTFLATESAGMVRGFPLVGVVSTQAAVPARCTLKTPLQGLMDCQVHKRAEVVVETRDADGVQLSHGGEKIGAELRHRDASNRKVPVLVCDRRDGTYSLSFVPEAPGRLALTVTVHNAPIQGSPFPVLVRIQKAHQGQYHCCCFCSSGGSKDATCGCGATMPGGYMGCGHGHLGHPGRRHWSCCGNVLENSECTKRGRSNSAVYQFTL